MNFIRTIVTSLLVLTVLLSTLMVPYLYIDFNLNRDHIAKELCINRDQPITVCGGQCYLNDRLKEVNGQQEKEESSLVKPFNITFFNSSIEQINFSKGIKILTQVPVLQDVKGLPRSFLSDIFHPPKSTSYFI